jgi:putative addiction module killer protein
LEAVPFAIEIYETETGRVPFSEWLTALSDTRTVARILLRLDRAKQGNLGDHKRITDGIFEFRVDTGAGYRVYFGRISNQVIVLLCGGDKSTQQRDIEKAEQYWIDYRSRDNA